MVLAHGRDERRYLGYKVFYDGDMAEYSVQFVSTSGLFTATVT